jgi:predicted ATPase
MLKRLYVDNFRCLVDFELNFDSINLFLGDNGAGKSSVFDILEKLQKCITSDDKVGSIFPVSDITLWLPRVHRKYELEILSNEGVYKYELKIAIIEPKVDTEAFDIIIESERLEFNNETLLNAQKNKILIQLDNGEKIESQRYNYYQSIVSLLKPDNNNRNLILFRETIKRLLFLKIYPHLINDFSSQKETFLTKRVENYVSWFRYIFIENSDKINQLTLSLQEVLDGFIRFEVKQISEKTVVFMLVFSNEIKYFFSQLSDGQRTLVVLYSLLYGLESQDYTLCIDEPENFLALPEIQPWLFQLEDLCSEGKLQALLISHHPQLIDYLLTSPIGYWFERQANSAVKVKPINSELQKCNESGLSMSELITRRWLSE